MLPNLNKRTFTLGMASAVALGLAACGTKPTKPGATTFIGGNEPPAAPREFRLRTAAAL